MRKLKMGDIEPDAVCYKNGVEANTVAHRQRKDGSPEFTLAELKHIVKCWNAFEEGGSHAALWNACKAFMKFAHKDIPKGIYIPKKWLDKLKEETSKLEAALALAEKE